jgi:Immunity protein family (Imm11)
MFYQVMHNIYADRGVVADPVPRPGLFRLGRIITEAMPVPVVFSVSNTDTDPPTAMEGISVPAWSGALVRCVQSAGADNLQLFPAVLANAQLGRQWDDYFAVNVLGLVGCMSKSSKVTHIADRPGGAPLVKVHKLVIDPRRVSGAELFRLAESPGVLLMHERLLAAMKQATPPGGWGLSVKPVAEEAA